MVHFSYMFSLLLCVYLVVGLLGHRANVGLIIWGTASARFFSKGDAPFTFPPAVYGGCIETDVIKF